ncbi:MAG: triose-phosphate isomerase [Deltaproteobacteria bacterium]|nr:triose-phosphate isomerase [Deltaproteobacteria bacterium]
MHPNRRPFLAGNWKMNLTVSRSVALAAELQRVLERLRAVDIGLFPTALALHAVATRLAGSRLLVGAQNVHGKGFGAFTGENSVDMLREAGATWCLVGHSERRHLFGETIADTGRKVLDLAAAGIRTILCVGETLQEREAGKTLAILEAQLRGGLAGHAPASPADLVIAYEPVWAIGTGHTASTAQVDEVHTWIRGWLRERFGAAAGDAIRIQYGGSVKPSNAPELLAVPDVDGALVGGAALDAESFVAIVKAAVPGN